MHQISNDKYQVSSTFISRLVPCSWWSEEPMDSVFPFGASYVTQRCHQRNNYFIKWKSITTWKSDCEWLLTLVLHQMTRNSPKFVEVVGAVLITSGFLILGESILYHLLGCFNFKQTLGFMFIADVAQPHPNNKI